MVHRRASRRNREDDMSKLVTGDGRTHIASSLMRESLVDKRVIAKTASEREYEIMPDVALVSIGGQSIFDRGEVGAPPARRRARLAAREAQARPRRRRRHARPTYGERRARPRAPHRRDRPARRRDGGVQRGLPERAPGQAGLDRDAARALLGAAALPRQRDAPDRDLDPAVPLLGAAAPGGTGRSRRTARTSVSSCSPRCWGCGR